MVSDATIFSSFDFVVLCNVVLVLANKLGQETIISFKSKTQEQESERVRERESKRASERERARDDGEREMS